MSASTNCRYSSSSMPRSVRKRMYASRKSLSTSPVTAVSPLAPGWKRSRSFASRSRLGDGEPHRRRRCPHQLEVDARVGHDERRPAQFRFRAGVAGYQVPDDDGPCQVSCCHDCLSIEPHYPFSRRSDHLSVVAQSQHQSHESDAQERRCERHQPAARACRPGRPRSAGRCEAVIAQRRRPPTFRAAGDRMRRAERRPGRRS